MGYTHGMPHVGWRIPENYGNVVLRCLTSLQLTEFLMKVYLTDVLRLRLARQRRLDGRKNYYRKFAEKGIGTIIKQFRNHTGDKRLARNIERVMTQRNYVAHRCLAECYWRGQEATWLKQDLQRIRKIDRSATGCWKRVMKYVGQAYRELKPYRA